MIFDPLNFNVSMIFNDMTTIQLFKVFNETDRYYIAPSLPVCEVFTLLNHFTLLSLDILSSPKPRYPKKMQLFSFLIRITHAKAKEENPKNYD